MILTKKEILNEIKSGKLKISPFNPKNIGPASIDLTLDNKFRIFKQREVINVSEKTDYRKYAELVQSNELVLRPGQFALGLTKERIRLPEDICGWLSGRSRFARLGLLVHITASFVQPGVDNHQVLEMRNVSPNTLVVKAGTAVCQIILERCEGKARYKGKFAKQVL